MIDHGTMRFATHADLAPIGKLGRAFAKVKAAIERDDFRSADVKKLHNNGFYRAKLDDTNRLLLQFVRHEGERVCIAIELIENHAYDRSRFLRGARADVGAIELEVAVDSPAAVEAAALPFIHPARAEFQLLDKPISFDDAQDAIYRVAPPLVLVGAAGSGKTALLLAKLRNVEGEVAYVTRSPYLASRSREIFFSHGFEREGQEASFLSLDALLESIRVPPGRAVQFRDFAPWFARHRHEVRFADAHQAFEEIRGVLSSQPEGPLSLESYLALGVRQSIFAAREREALHRLFEKYRGWLGESGLFEPNLVAHGHLAEAAPRYDFVAVDEVQDLTSVELTLILKTLREKGAFILAGDSNQIVHPNFFSWASVKTLFFRDASLGGGGPASVLEVNYRNGRAVTALANTLLKVKHARFGSVDRESGGLVRSAAVEEGEVAGLPGEDAVLAELDEKTRRSTETAVLVLRDEHKEEARRRFRTPLVFSVHEAKGLEYPNVVLYRFVSSERAAYGEIADGVGTAALEVEELTFRRARDKEDKSLEIYKFYVNALYVAITRATRRVYLIESDVDHPLLRLLGVGFRADARAVAAEKSSVEAWQREVRKLELQGKDEQVDAIRRTILGTAPVPWTVLDAAGYRALADKGLPANSVSNKARQTLFEYACFHQQAALADRLRSIGFAQATRYEAQILPARDRAVAGFGAKKTRDVLWQTERHGLEFRSPMNLTPLMLATLAGNAELARGLVERGARLDATDHFGKTAMHWALVRALEDAAYAKSALAPLFELVAPPVLDVDAEGRLERIGRERGEYLYFAIFVAIHARLYRSRFSVRSGFATADALEGVGAFPGSVMPAFRKKRTYLNGLLARNERSSNATPNRRLWIRVQHGHYRLNPALRLRVVDARGDASWAPIAGFLGSELLAEHVARLPGSELDAR